MVHHPPKPGVCLRVLPSLPAPDTSNWNKSLLPSQPSALQPTRVKNSSTSWLSRKVSEPDPRADYFCCLLTMLQSRGRGHMGLSIFPQGHSCTDLPTPLPSSCSVTGPTFPLMHRLHTPHYQASPCCSSFSLWRSLGSAQKLHPLYFWSSFIPLKISSSLAYVVSRRESGGGINIEALANCYQRHIHKLEDLLRIFKIYVHQGLNFRKTGAGFGNREPL